MKTRKRLLCVLSIALAGLGLAGCRDNTARPPPAERPNRRLLIDVAGSTFGYPIYSKWFGDYHQIHPEVEMNYASIGSGAGIAQLRAGTVDLGASDMPLNDELLRTFNVKVVQFATVLGAVVPIYNLPGISASLKFTPEAIAGIYLGQITMWNDPVIATANPGVKLSAKKIIVVHRSDGSGTTFVWTDYLSKVSPQWKKQVGRSTAVRWPVGLGGKGSEGVTGIVEQMPYSFGYVELIYALQNHLLYGEVENSSGAFIEATLGNVTAAAASSTELEKDIRASITNAPGRDAYPVSTFTYLLVPAAIENPAKRSAIKGFLKWMLTDGQKSVAGLSYAPLPSHVVEMELARIAEIK